jgi:hypothetical protein
MERFMSQMAILLLLAAAQIDDRGWQPNPKVNESVRSAQEKKNLRDESVNRYEIGRQDRTNLESVEPASYDELGFDYNEDALGGYDSRDFDLTNDASDATAATRNTRPRENNTVDNRFRDNSRVGSRPHDRQSDLIDAASRAFWDAHDLFLDDDSPLEQTAQPIAPRFRRVDSWAVPIPLLPALNSGGQVAASDVNARPSDFVDNPMDRLDERRYLNRDRRPNDDYSTNQVASDSGYRNYYIDETDGSANVRRPASDARQLNENGIDQPMPVENENFENDVDSGRDIPRTKLPLFDLTRMIARGPSSNMAVSDQTNSANGNAANSDSPINSASGRRLWASFLLATVILFASLGFNFYLGLNLWDIHGRYQDIVADLTEVESLNDDRAPSLLEPDKSGAFSNRPERAISRRRSISI